MRLGIELDCGYSHDAICWMTTEALLRRALATVFALCRSGGAAPFAPDHACERFGPSTDHGGFDGLVRVEHSYIERSKREIVLGAKP